MITASGQQTFETAKIGLVKATVVCMGGNWTSYPLAPATLRVISDGHAASGPTTITSPTASFTAAELGGAIAGAGIPSFDTITAVTSATTAQLTLVANATTTTGGFTITPANVLRTASDGVVTSGSLVVTSATANFTSADVGGGMAGTGIPAFDSIVSVTNSTTAVISSEPCSPTLPGSSTPRRQP